MSSLSRLTGIVSEGRCYESGRVRVSPHCPRGEVIHTLRAFTGVTPHDRCSYTHDDCTLPASRAAIKRCDNHRQCTLVVNPGRHLGPLKRFCGGDTAYFYIEYRCLPGTRYQQRPSALTAKSVTSKYHPLC